LRVVDLTDLRGALAGRILADLGADVIKVEPPGGDPDRLTAPFAGGVVAPDRSLPFLFRHANKRGAVIDLHDAEGWRRFCRLCEDADILLENLGSSGQRRHGLVPAEVRERHPHLVHVAIADFGLTGPHAEWRLEALPAFAASGALWSSGFPDRPPCWLPGYAAHDCAAAFALAGALAVILDRTRHGRGDTVEVSVQEAGVSGLNPWPIMMADYARHYPMLPVVSRRNGDGAYYVLPTADGYVRVLPASPRQWRAYLKLLGDPEALEGPHWEMPLFRLGNADVVRVVSEAALADRPRADVLREGRRLDVPITAVNTLDDFVAEEQTRVRGYFRRPDFPHLPGAPFAPSPFNFSRTPAVLTRPAPAPGQDDGGFAAGAGDPSLGAGRRLPLAGIRVVDLGVGVAIPETGMMLAEFGAEVIKIESCANLDFLRRLTVEPDTPNRSWTFNDASRAHDSVALDLRTPRGRELALALCARADVVLENNRGGVAAAWGLDYDDVRRVRPDVIYVASQGYGRGGPLGEASAFGPLNSAFSGVTWLWNHPDAPYPAGASLNHPDHVAAKLTAVAVLAALEHRRRTGEGQLVEMSQAETAAYLVGEFYLGGAAQRGNASESACPHGVYACAGEERWVAIAVVGDEAWRRFASALGWSAEPRLATLAGRLAARAELDERVAEWTRTRSAEECAETLQAAGVSAMPVQHGNDLRADAHLAARGGLVTVTHAEIGPERHIGNPLRLAETPLAPPAPAPCLGAHSEDVLVRVLGLARDEVARLVDDGVCR
jgi:crotonobetainyl-CoA:carnitine CoA-transferase CaiB-like acyl-CoA transferase